MIIRDVVINNFYCFLDRNELVFDKGLNIVSSPNSGGKSQLFNALYWTFFDSVYIKDDNSSKKTWRSAKNLILCPDAYSKNSNFNGKINTFVEITLEAEHPDTISDNNDLVTYIFNKNITYEKSEKSVAVFSKPELIISYLELGETKIVNEGEHNRILDKIFPESIRKFMWYQGETVDELYDFSQPHTLKYAIKELSYYPIYDTMQKIVKVSLKDIDDKIEKAQRNSKSLTAEQGKLITEIRSKKNDITSKEETINLYQTRIGYLNEQISIIEEGLKNSEKYSELKNQLIEKEYKEKRLIDQIKDIEIELKTKLVTKWMLAGCENLILESQIKLDSINSEIQKFSKSSNPVPMSLPGPDYIEKMLNDKICYICEREVANPSEAYDALKKRLDDFEKSSTYKMLQDNFTDLTKSKRYVLEQLEGIKEEIEIKNKKKLELFSQRKEAYDEIQKLLKSSGTDKDSIKSRGNSVEQLLSKHKTYRSEKESKLATVKSLESDIYKLKESIKPLQAKLESKTPADILNLVEVSAKKYIEFFEIITEILNREAYSKFISDLQIESNKLYSLYLGGNPQGEIIINEGIQVVDFKTRENLDNVNTAEEVAQKLGVAYAFLSLSEKVKNKSYPIIADAPTSDFDPENTINLTMNIGKSFEQIIILSKDYSFLSEKERNKLINDANIVKYYEFDNDIINDKIVENDLIKSRINKKTFIKQIK